MPNFKVMLAASEIPGPNQLPPKVLASTKFDGIRTVALEQNAFSRNMELIPNAFVQHWFHKYANWIDGFDGELIVGEPNKQSTFNTTSSGVMSIEGNPDFRFYVFDVVSIDALCMGASARYELYKYRIKQAPKEVRDRIVCVNQTVATSFEFLQQLHDQTVAQGYEGLILKHAHGYYKQGRSTLKEGILLKFKDFADSEIRIESLQQGKSNQNEKTTDALGYAKRSSHKAGKVALETIGSFIGPDINPASPFFGQKIKVGPGNFKKSELEELWAKHRKWEDDHMEATHSPVLGRILTYKYQKSGYKDAPRFPQAKGFRNEIDM